MADYDEHVRAQPETARSFDGKLALSIAQLCAATPCGKSLIYSEVAAGRLRLRKIGKRTIFLVEDVRNWLEGR